MDIQKFDNIGQIYIVSAPSGAGKTSLVKAVCENNASIRPSISYTTRKKRDSEIEGNDYFFISEKEFHKKIDKGKFLEYQNVYGNLYGTSIDYTLDIVNKGYDVILEIDYKGMLMVKEILPQSVSIYILPPNIETLKKRLDLRGQDKSKTVDLRMESSEREFSYAKFADYVIINDVFSDALRNITAIILFGKLKSPQIISWVKSITAQNN
jgi:guanylate kinase